MRRRIYMDPESGPEDCTARPSLWGFAKWNDNPEPPLVLRDESLWAEYEAAREALRCVEVRIQQACVVEPWSSEEQRLGIEFEQKLHGDDDDAMDRISEIEDELLVLASSASTPAHPASP